MRQGSLDLIVPEQPAVEEPPAPREERLEAVRDLAWEVRGRALDLYLKWEELDEEGLREFLRVSTAWAVEQPVALYAMRYNRLLLLAVEEVLFRIRG